MQHIYAADASVYFCQASTFQYPTPRRGCDDSYRPFAASNDCTYTSNGDVEVGVGSEASLGNRPATGHLEVGGLRLEHHAHATPRKGESLGICLFEHLISDVIVGLLSYCNSPVLPEVHLAASVRLR